MKFSLTLCWLLLLVWICCGGSASARQRNGELVRNGTMEGGGGSDGKGGGVPEWEPFGLGYRIDRDNHHGGDQSIRCDSLNTGKERGAQMRITLNQTRPISVLVSGWSKADQVAGVNPVDYSLYIDAEYMDGTPLYGQIATFRAGTHDWQRRQVLVVPAKPLKFLTVIALFRNHTGTAWFDDFSAHALEGTSNFDSQPLTAPPFPTITGPRFTVTGSDGLAIDLNSRGGLAAVKMNGQAVSSATGGFYLRDVAKDGPLVPIQGATTVSRVGGYNIGSNVRDLQVGFNAKVVAREDAILVDGEITDQTKTDRAVSVYLALPVEALGWQWGQDIRNIQTITTGQEYSHQTQVNVGAMGGLSLYPYGCVANTQGGVGVASQMDWPSVYRIFYNSTTRQLVIGWDFALSRKTAAWPSGNARFRCQLFRLPAGPSEWCFRQATQRFYRMNARAFARRAKQDGVWLPFTDPAKVEKSADFGFAFHEGDNSVKSDDALGILSFRYTEPMTYWLPMPPAMPRTYENALALIQKNAAGETRRQGDKTKGTTAEQTAPTLYEWAQAVLNSGTQDESGRYNLEFRNEPWANGAVFVLNPNPELPATPDKPTKAWITYTVSKGIQTYDKADKMKVGDMDGEYLDSLEGWADTLNYRASHLQACPYPITFDLDNRLPVIPQWYSTHTFTRFLSQDLHNRNKLLMANTAPVRFSIFAPLLDVAGIEVNWLDGNGKWQPDTDATFNFRRTMSAQKPYLLLMNTDYDKFTPALVEKYFQRSLFYSVFPSMFSQNAADHPYWETPRWYNRDRPLFQKYIPIIKRLSAAGWEAVPYAHSSEPGVYVERYGNRLFTLLNDSAQPHATTLTLDVRALNLPATLHAFNLITNTEVPIQHTGATLTLAVSLNAEEAAAIEIR